MISTRSAFYFGHTIVDDNSSLDFNEGGSELQATLNIGDYTLTSFIAEIKRALDAAGSLTYTVSVNRTTRVITIAATGTFALLVSSGSRSGSTVFGLMGFTGSDRTGAATYSGDAASGSEYLPQALLYDYIASDDWSEKRDAVVNESASGRIQTVQFGTVAFLQLNIRHSTDFTISARQPEIETQVNGVLNLRTFMAYLITKAQVEFMADRATRSIFETVILESPAASKQGTSFKLKENAKAPGYYDTDVMTFRVA